MTSLRIHDSNPQTIRIRRHGLVVLVAVILMTIVVNPTTAQTTGGNNNNTVDEDLIDRPSTEIDLDGCFRDLALSDRNGDGAVKQNEYLNFVQEYGKRICFETDALTLQQSSTFIKLACICDQLEGASSDCCLGDNAQIPVDGALSDSRSASQTSFLTTVCKLTDDTIDSRCPPVVEDRGEPVVPIVPGNGGTAGGAGGGGGGLSDAAMWGIIAAALALLLICCCCFLCVWKRRRPTEEEEEEEEIRFDEDEQVATDLEKGIDLEQPMDQTVLSSDTTQQSRGMDFDEEVPKNEPADDVVSDEELGDSSNIPAGVSPMTAGSVARGTTERGDSDEEEEVRKKRGGGNIDSEPDEDSIRYVGAPGIPPPDTEPQPSLQLRPVPDKDEYDDGWDQPGRDIQYPIEKDELSAGEVEHYEPDGGVYFPDRPTRDPSDWSRTWNRSKPDEPDEVDLRKHRIQSGLGEGEVWNQLGQDSFHGDITTRGSGDGMDWVIQSALGALEDTTIQQQSQQPQQQQQQQHHYQQQDEVDDLSDIAQQLNDANDNDDDENSYQDGNKQDKQQDIV